MVWEWRKRNEVKIKLYSWKRKTAKYYSSFHRWRFWVPRFKKTENEVKSREVSLNKSATESVWQDGVRSTLRDTGMRKPFSVSAPVSAQNTPHQGRKRSKMLDLSTLNTSAIFQPIKTQHWRHRLHWSKSRSLLADSSAEFIRSNFEVCSISLV